MSRDSRLLHSHLRALQEHLNAGQDQISETAGQVHAELDAQRSAPMPEEYAPPVFELPSMPPAPVDTPDTPSGAGGAGTPPPDDAPVGH